ncbi:DUF3866 family protein [Paenibacillus elgii]|uniref:DUF3866 family protein n=1 Tax=Paenibacillus elgii TaxID=189691 RepID=UPI00203FC2C3|nr:DUF3866 family protein [Paenibacillus elgii]MCM3269314.1 DUF3866 family protein [Paenibacillus elgii]
MRIQWETAVVTEMVGEPWSLHGLQEVRVRLGNGETAAALYDLTVGTPLRPGDEVLLNTTAVRLGLGTGGVHFVHAKLGRLDESVDSPEVPVDANLQEPETPDRLRSFGPQEGHMMKLRYTSLQRAVLSVEEQSSPHHALFAESRTLGGMPVLIGELHSMLPAAVCWLRELAREAEVQAPRIAYVMTDGGALPMAISRHVRRLRELGWLVGTVTYGHAYGGDIEAVNKYTALLAARHVLEADIAIVCMGPGIVGTGTPYGFSGIESGELVGAVHALGGAPVAMARISFADPRPQHCGLSRHTAVAIGQAALAPAIVPLPWLPAEADTALLREQVRQSGLARRHRLRWEAPPPLEHMAAALEAYGQRITSMGRSLQDDPAFFAAICTAAGAAYRLLRNEGPDKP